MKWGELLRKWHPDAQAYARLGSSFGGPQEKTENGEKISPSAREIRGYEPRMGVRTMPEPTQIQGEDGRWRRDREKS